MSTPIKFTPCGIDVGRSCARIGLSNLILTSNPPPTPDPTFPHFTVLTEILSNAMGSRYTPCHAICEDTLADFDEEGNSLTAGQPAAAFVFGESAKKSLLRTAVTLANKADLTQQHSALGWALDSAAPKESRKCAEKFYSHLKELAYEASGLGAKNSDRLRVVLSVPAHMSPAEVASVVEAAKKGFVTKACLLDVVSDVEALATCHSLTGSTAGTATPVNMPPAVHASWGRCVVANWGASGLALSSVRRVGSSDAIFVRKACSPIAALSGEKIVQLMMEHSATTFQRKTKLDCMQSTKAVGKLRLACETAVRTLARGATATVEADGLCEGEDLRVPVSRPRFDMMVSSFLASAEASIKEFIAEDGPAEEVDVLLLAGAVFEMPTAVELIKGLIGRAAAAGDKPATWYGVGNVAVDEAIAAGCAIHAAILLEAGIPSSSPTSVANAQADAVDSKGCRLSVALLGRGTDEVQGAPTDVVTEGTLCGVMNVRVVGTGNAADGALVDIALLDRSGGGNKIVARIRDLESKNGGARVGVMVNKGGAITLSAGGVTLTL